MNLTDLEQAVNAFWTFGEPPTNRWVAVLIRLAKVICAALSGALGSIACCVPPTLLVLEIRPGTRNAVIVTLAAFLAGIVTGVIIGLKCSWSTIGVFMGASMVLGIIIVNLTQ